MYWLSVTLALLAAIAILGVGLGYLAIPRKMAPSFGLALPGEDETTTWWLRLKGVRDTASAVLLLTFIAAVGHRNLGIVLLVEALIPIGDMSTVLASGGRTATALGVHGVTAVVMLLSAVPLLMHQD